MSYLSFTIYVQGGIAYEPSWSPFPSLEPLRFGAASREPKSEKRVFILGLVSSEASLGNSSRAKAGKSPSFSYKLIWVSVILTNSVRKLAHRRLIVRDVSGTCTSVAKKEKLENKGLEAYHFDANEPDYPAGPTSELSKLRLAAEERWLNLGNKLQIAAHVFRLGGIYGPGRSAVDKIIKREALSEDQRRAFRLYTSRIHVEDVCQALKASFYASSPGEVYNIVDDDPAPREEVFAYAQNLIEKKWPGRITRIPEQEESSVTIKKEGFTAENRVSNARLKKELGVRLLHPSYRTGLKSIVDQMDNPFHHSLLDS